MPPEQHSDADADLVVAQDMLAQLRQDITTAGDAGDEAAVRRLRAELEAALEDSDAVLDDDSEAGRHTGDAANTTPVSSTDP